MTFENFIPPRSKTVLEVTGEVAADFETTRNKFLEIQPACDYSVAKNFAKVKGKFDTILIQSALIGNMAKDELVKLIKDAAAKLKARGTLIFSLENIGFIENVMAILEGQPLKFKVTLTRVELENAIADAGINLLRSLHAARRIEISQNIKDLAKIDTAVFTYIISATPDELPPKTVIQAVIGEKLVCAPIRIHTPNSFMVTEPNITTISTEPRDAYRLFSAEKYTDRIFINQRISFPSFTNGKLFFEQLKELGYLFIEEIDDNPVLWREKYEQIGWINFIGVHGIQTSTEYLADFLREYNPNIKVFHNQLRRILPLRDFAKNETVTIFFGALNRDKDFNEILPVINDFAQEYGDKLAFKIIANTELFESIQSTNKTLVGNPNYYNGQFAPYEVYEKTLRESDIALLPLLDNEFNRSKSDLKFIECAGNGCVALASPVVYAQTVKDGETGFIFNNNQEFAEKLRALIDKPNKRREIATAAYEYVKHNRLLSQHYEERLDWYRELLKKLPELNAETQARLDKVAPRFANELASIENEKSQVEGISKPNAEIIIPSEW